MPEGIQQALQSMEQEGLPAAVVSNFKRLALQVAANESGIIEESEIEPLSDLPRLEALEKDPYYALIGQEALKELVVVRLNGGLGTSMGLDRAKSLLPVKNGLSFNDIIVRQIQRLGEDQKIGIPLVHMTSFSTDADVKQAMQQAGFTNKGGIPTTFQQFKHPKLYADTLAPAQEPDEELNWNPPGHGDIYAALISTGLAAKLLDQGKRYMFVANADNLGATVETTILGYFKKSGSPFMMEVAERTPADSKGGHLARWRTSRRLVLRETAQAPTGPDGKIAPEFGDIRKYCYFNTNSIWLDLQTVLGVAREHGCIPLPLIRNSKTVNPRDKSSRKVFQLETAMGAAIEVFEGATALEVPRLRFAPVKNNNELLTRRSDLYVLTPDFKFVVNPERVQPALPEVNLDSKYFGMISDFDKRVRVCPSLLRADSFVVQGDVVLARPLEVRGRVSLVAPEGKQVEVMEDLRIVADRTVMLSS
jgi:UTP--glucose-1-phosphate uridylyltransferase